jgi:putative ABC transport system permease protein
MKSALAVYAWKLVTRNPRRTFTYLFGLALAVGLFAGILFFIDVITRQMTTTALTPVKLDMIAHVNRTDMNLNDIAATLARVRNIAAAEPVISTDFSSASKVDDAQTTPAGRLFAINPSYLRTFDVLKISEGSFDPNGVMVSEAMATVQKLKIGDTLQISFAGITDPVKLPISGIVNMGSADAMFVTPSGAEGGVFADVVLMDANWFRGHLQMPLAAVAASRPASILPTTTVLGQQVHIKINRAAFPADPSVAALQAAALQRELERSLPGQIKVLDNVSGAFKSAMSDVLTAKILFIFLGLPGVALAAYLSKFAAELFADAQRREIGLLRTRGATPGQITAIIGVTSALLALMGSVLGVCVGLLLLIVSTGSQALTALNPFSPGFEWSVFAQSAGSAFVAGVLLTFFAAFLPVYSTLRNEITQERRRVRRADRAPFWKRAYLDLICIGASIVVNIVTQATGGLSTGGSEGAVLSLSFYVFLGPFFAWIGLTLLVLRLVERGLSSLDKHLAALYKRCFGDIGEVAGKSIARRAANISAATTIIALTLSFGLSLALFQYTYSLEKQRDARYVAGSDIRFTPSLNTPQTADFARQLTVPGVTSVTGVMRDPQALVGSSNQTVYGIDVPSYRQAAYVPDRFYVDGAVQQTIDAINSQTRNTAPGNYAPGTADKVLGALERTPNGVILAVDQAQKFNILVGDPVLLRLFNPNTRHYVDVKTVAVGMYLQSSTSSQDSDFILNRDFMEKAIGSDAMSFFLIKTDGQPGVVALATAVLQARFKSAIPFHIDSVNTVVNADASSLTALNLAGLGTMERIYTLLIISVGMAIFLMAMINERRREFGAMRALGANLRHLRRFLFAEASTIGVLSIIIGAVIGFGLARMLVLLLGAIFMTPTTALEAPWLELATLLLLVAVGMIISTYISSRRLATLKVVDALREL